jgi:RHS repeat-associated protein
MRYLAPVAWTFAALFAPAVSASDLRFEPCPSKAWLAVTETRPPTPTTCVVDQSGVVRAVLYPPGGLHDNEVAVFAQGRRYQAHDAPTMTFRLGVTGAPATLASSFGALPAELAERIETAAGLRREAPRAAPPLPPPLAPRLPERLAPAQEQVLARYQYDWRGRVSLKIGAEGVRQYVYDGDSNRVLNEFDGQGNLVATYQWAGDVLAAITRPGQGTRYPAHDGLGSVVGLGDETGTVTARYHYDVGGGLRDAAELAADPNRYAFTGHRFETETGFYRTGARYLAPDFGRFLTADSYLGKPEDPFSLHRYLYANANPLRYVDPDGHQSKDLANEYRLYREGLRREEFGSWCGAHPQACAAKLSADAARERDASTRVAGTLRILGGAAQVVAGAGALLAPEPTGATKAAGALALARGFDNAQAGMRQAATGEVVETASGVAIRKGLDAAGAPPEAAAQLQWATEVGLDLGTGAAATRAARIGASAGGGPIPVPMLTGTKGGELLRDAIGRVRATQGNANEKADFFEALAAQIEERTAGTWHATRIKAGDGSHVFVGKLGETLVVNPEGQLFRGNVMALRPRPDGLITPDFDALRKLE